ncbi:cysteine-rich venom protein helothermine-like [Tiliqua scincoides]|uniref:cysteine-rich venom protein helothermine-like n=1 Tax=Tiliqua scincoides TaxID=71010 RepID=UPI0034628310
MILLTSYMCLAAILHHSGQASADVGALKTTNAAQQEEIVDEHNKLRRSVNPPAKNMLRMEWSSSIAANAQRWADQCTLQHSSQESRVVDGMTCGENLYMSSNADSWRGAIQAWHSEVKDFQYGTGQKTPKAVIGHYTQVVWFNSFRVGCAIAYCPQQPALKYYYVCQYAFGGNIQDMIKTPYKSGSPCGDCPNACDNGLCTNPCLYSDLYANCPQLKAQVGCSHAITSQHCHASCLCTTEIK